MRIHPEMQTTPAEAGVVYSKNFGDVLLSQGVYPQVPSALTGLTSVFEMGTGVTLSLWSPKIFSQCVTHKDSRASTSDYSSPRPISTGRLNALPHVHLRPINVVV